MRDLLHILPLIELGRTRCHMRSHIGHKAAHRLLVVILSCGAMMSIAASAETVALPGKLHVRLPSDFHPLPDAELRALHESTVNAFGKPTVLLYAANRRNTTQGVIGTFNLRALTAHTVTQEHLAALDSSDPKFLAPFLADMSKGTTMLEPPSLVRVGKRQAVMLRYSFTVDGTVLYTDAIRIYDGPHTVFVTCSYRDGVADGAAVCATLLRSLH